MSYKGTSMQDIYHGDGPWDFYTLPVLVSSYHTILYHLKPNLKDPPAPHTSAHKYHWDEGYVRMPYSPKNVFPSKDDNGEEVLVSRWELIKKTLMQDIDSSRAFEAAVNAYNSRLPKFHALHYLFEEDLNKYESKHFFSNVLPGIVNLAIQLPDIVPGSIPLLKADHCRSLSLSQKQIACLLANAFLCTFPGRKGLAQSYPSINFISLFSARSESQSVVEKIKCITHYFERIFDKMPCGVVTFERQHINRTNLPRWDKIDNNLGNVRVHIDSEGTIEDDGLGLLQVDFANKFLGGGVLGYGCVQEEIRFVICPELLVTRLFTEKLGNNESLIIIGAEKFSKYRGYGDTFLFDNNFVDETPFDEYARKRTNIVAIDATQFSKSLDQFNSGSILRELNKAYVGFHSRATGTLTAVATGNWGCGAFGGDAHLKFLIQLMAASAARRDLVYYTFGSTTLRDEIYNMYTFIATNQITVTQLWRLLCKFISAELKSNKFFPFIQQAYFDTKKQPTITAAFSHVQAIAQKQPKDTLREQPSTSRSNDIYVKKSTITSSNNNKMEWNEELEYVDSNSDEISSHKDRNCATRSPQVLKRKRKTSSCSSNDLLSLINKIDGCVTSTESESSHNSSLGFLTCVDEYSKHQHQVKSNEDKERTLSRMEEGKLDLEEEMDVEEILENLATEKTKMNNSNITTPKRKITDYFKKP